MLNDCRTQHISDRLALVTEVNRSSGWMTVIGKLIIQSLHIFSMHSFRVTHFPLFI